MTAEEHRALALLSASPEGLTESLLVYAHQVPVEAARAAGDRGGERSGSRRQGERRFVMRKGFLMSMKVTDIFLASAVCLIVITPFATDWSQLWSKAPQRGLTDAEVFGPSASPPPRRELTDAEVFGSSPDKPVCMSDDELRAVLSEGAMFLLGYAGATCCKRAASPDAACRKMTQEVQKFEKTAEPYLRINRGTALAPFKRSFGSQAERMSRANSDAMKARLKATARTYDQRQRSNLLNTIEGFSYLDQRNVGGLMPNLVTPTEFAAARPSVPRC
jgi:hypothetical protein